MKPLNDIVSQDPDVVIRLADKEDTDELARLRWDWSEDDPQRVQTFLQFLEEFKSFFHDGLDDGKWLVFVAESPERLVANVWLELVDKVPRPIRDHANSWGYLTNVYTEPAFRGKGIGRRLLETVVSAAHVLKLELIIVWPSDESVEFYKREGFAPNPMLLERQRDEGSRRVRKVIVTEYDSNWPRIFGEEKKLIESAIGEHIVAIEHVGSTSVPGLGAKPIIDIQVGVRRLLDFKKCIRPLQEIGYEHHPAADADIPDERRYFRKSTDGVRSHHLHMCEFRSDWWINHLAFRDHLRENPEDARKYYELKKDLAPKYEWDTIGYTEAKTEFIVSVMERIRKERS